MTATASAKHSRKHIINTHKRLIFEHFLIWTRQNNRPTYIIMMIIFNNLYRCKFDRLKSSVKILGKGHFPPDLFYSLINVRQVLVLYCYY